MQHNWRKHLASCSSGKGSVSRIYKEPKQTKYQERIPTKNGIWLEEKLFKEEIQMIRKYFKSVQHVYPSRKCRLKPL